MNNTQDLLIRAKKDLMYVADKPDIVFAEGKGSFLWDTDGNKYLDMIAGWAVCCLGHSSPVIVNTLYEQSQQLINPSPSFYNVPSIEFAELLCRISCMEKVFFSNSGAEANEGAIKLARKYGQKYKNGAYEIITAWNGFHGRTLAAMAASGKKAWDGLYLPKPEGFTRVDYNDIEALKSAISSNTCAVMLELVQGEGGVIVSNEDYIHEVRTLCDEHDILLIIDEVQTGLGRLGHMFAYEAYNIEPDIITLAKGIGGGFPLSALLAKEKFCCFDPGDQGGTYCAAPLATAVGKAVVEEIIASDLVNNARTRGDYFRDKLNLLREKHDIVEGIRGKGLLLAVALGEELAHEIKEACMKKMMIINAPNSKSLRFMPALNTTYEEIDEAVSILEDVLGDFC